MEPARRVWRTISSLFALAVVLVTVWAAGALLSPIPPLTAEAAALDLSGARRSTTIALPEQGRSADCP